MHFTLDYFSDVRICHFTFPTYTCWFDHAYIPRNIKESVFNRNFFILYRFISQDFSEGADEFSTPAALRLVQIRGI